MALKVKNKKPKARALYRNILFLFLLSIICCSYFLYKTQVPENFIEDKISDVSKDTGFIVETISITRNNEYCPIVTETILDEYKGQPILLVSLEKIQAQIESFDCVKSANISRAMPSQIKVDVTNQQPIAIWQSKKQFFFVTGDNKLMKIRNATNLADFIIVTGDDAYMHTAELIAMLSVDKNIMSQIDAAMRVGDRRWDIKMKTGTEIKLPEKDPEIAWSKFVQLKNTSTEFQENKFKTVDFRISDKIYTN